LTGAVIDAFLLLNACTGEEIDRATAQRATVSIRENLRRLRHDDQVELRAQLEDIAEESDDPDFRAVVAGIADTVGLAHPRPGEHLSWR
jgi:hypothetical protein